MLARRIIPCLDVRDGRVVKGKKFEGIVDVDSPERLGKYYSKCGADELVFYDITASHEKRKTSLDFVSKVAENINIPFCVGGGISSINDFTDILRRGADKVSINSSAVINPNLIKEASKKFGAQCVVLSIDAKKEGKNLWRVYVKGGREKTELDAINWAIEGEKLGAGEIVVNSIDEDGMKNGYDIELLTQITQKVKIPVIASGGAGKMEHFHDVVKYANVDGILAASVFHFGEIKIEKLKEYLYQRGIPMRN
ncbi:imidazole glycerol phosphate synthase subunit HisF [Haloimpatiens sp. FM7330]|uniref:imidazole glycerol phosphate synthase subunit HisF n=1 Tax=Haloimpatiens sp. FM7330 TaxID=3298610 RepID=UPI003630B6B5